ncbi:MAG: hypothetical protein U5K79_04070 [Cyclobacteriaceae bacterium]|nr:hypothetical protein [Cyclobacteriaceae bacterium]
MLILRRWTPRTFKKYLISTLGVPEENITLLINATAGQMKQSIARLSALAAAYEGEAQGGISLRRARAAYGRNQ